MANNVVIFGKGNAGKTTLMGYMYARTLPEKKLNLLYSKFRRKHGCEYNDTERYSYLVNPYDEVARNADNECKGNTKRLHFAQWNNDIVIIDTPGSEHNTKLTTARNRGIFMGDIGIYVVTANKILDFETDFSEFSHIFLWNKLRPNKLIIALSQTDNVSSSEDVSNALVKANRMFNEQAKLNVKIVPISVNRNTDEISDVNIFTKDANMPFYDGETLASYITTLAGTENVVPNSPNFCIYAETYFDHEQKYGAGVGRTWRNKALCGYIEKGALIKVLPIKYERNYTIANAKIKNIRKLDNEDYNSAKMGEIIGLDISSVRIDGKVVDKSEITSIVGTLFVNRDCEVHWGNIIRFRLEANDVPVNRPFRPQETVQIFWFGRILEVNIINQYEKNQKHFIIAHVMDSFVTMPFVSKGFLIKRLPMILPDGVKTEVNKYINVNVDKIGIFDCAYIDCENETKLTAFKNIEQHLIGNDLELTTVGNRIYARAKKPNLIGVAVVRLLKDMQAALEQENLESLDIKVRIKEHLV